MARVSIKKRSTVGRSGKHIPNMEGAANTYRLNHSVYGSAALKPALVPEHAPGKTKKQQEDERRLRRAEVICKYKQKEKSVSKKRLRESFTVILAVLLIAGMFGVVLFRKAQIACLNFQNNAKEKRINTIQQDTAQIREALILGTDLEKVRVEATERLGMQRPGTNQIVFTFERKGDKLIATNVKRSVDISPDALAHAKDNLAHYFSSNE